MHIVDDKMSNQFSIYSCNVKINDVFSVYVMSHNAHRTLISTRNGYVLICRQRSRDVNY